MDRNEREHERARLIADLDKLRPILERIIATGKPRTVKRAQRELLHSEQLRARISGDHSRLSALREQMEREREATDARD